MKEKQIQLCDPAGALKRTHCNTVFKILRDRLWPQFAGWTRLDYFVPEFTSMKSSIHTVVGPINGKVMCTHQPRKGNTTSSGWLTVGKERTACFILASSTYGFVVLAPPWHRHHLGAEQKCRRLENKQINKCSHFKEKKEREKCRVSGLTLDLLSQNMNVNKTPRWVLYMLMFD